MPVLQHLLALAIERGVELEKENASLLQELQRERDRTNDYRYQLNKIRRMTHGDDTPQTCDEQACEQSPPPPTFEDWLKAQPQVMTKEFAWKKYKSIFGVLDPS